MPRWPRLPPPKPLPPLALRLPAPRLRLRLLAAKPRRPPRPLRPPRREPGQRRPHVVDRHAIEGVPQRVRRDVVGQLVERDSAVEFDGRAARADALLVEVPFLRLAADELQRARSIAEELLNSIVLVGDCADEDLLREENIDQTDVYMALTL